VGGEEEKPFQKVEEIVAAPTLSTTWGERGRKPREKGGKTHSKTMGRLVSRKYCQENGGGGGTEKGGGGGGDHSKTMRRLVPRKQAPNNRTTFGCRSSLRMSTSRLKSSWRVQFEFRGVLQP